MKSLYVSGVVMTGFMGLVGCGGGGGGGSSMTDGTACSNPATTTDRYLISSYDACDAHNNDLSGLWMVVSDYVVTSGGYERDQRQRMTMTIIKNNDGSYNAFICSRNGATRNYTFAAAASSITVYDEGAAANLQLSISNNLSMQGSHIASSGVVVQSSTASAVKIKDISPTPVGGVSLSYQLNGESFTNASLQTSCFRQRDGVMDAVSSSVLFNGESIFFFTTIDRNGAAEEVLLSVFKPGPTSGNELEIALDFMPSSDEIEGEDDGNTVATYQQNDAGGVKLNASVIDDINAANTAVFSLSVSL
jgi:hypothetical protein